MSRFVGDNVTLPCRTNSTYHQRWLYISSHNAPQDVIASVSHLQQLQLNNERVITLPDSQTSQEYNLTRYNVQLNETGWYICVAVSDSTLVHPFFLTVRGKCLQ